MWSDGRFVLVLPHDAVNMTNEAEADRLFLELLAKTNKRGMNVSPSRSITYAPTVLARMPAAKGIGKLALERAMHRLLDFGSDPRGAIWTGVEAPATSRNHVRGEACLNTGCPGDASEGPSS